MTLEKRNESRVSSVPSHTNARNLLIRAFELGRVDIVPRFGLSSVDAENLIRNGSFGLPRLDPDYDALMYEFCGKVDGKSYRIVVALDCQQDMWDNPLVTLIRAERTGGKKKS